MGYFSNGSEGMDYQSEHCDKCYWGDKACMIWLAHMLHNYEQCNNDESILHMFIPKTEDGLGNKKCKMFTPTPIDHTKVMAAFDREFFQPIKPGPFGHYEYNNRVKAFIQSALNGEIK